MENIRGFVNKPAYFRATYHTRKATAADKNFKKNIWKRTFEQQKQKSRIFRIYSDHYWIRFWFTFNV